MPDLPGCVATGATAEEAEQQIREAIGSTSRACAWDGLPIPVPSSRVEYVDVAV